MMDVEFYESKSYSSYNASKILKRIKGRIDLCRIKWVSGDNSNFKNRISSVKWDSYVIVSRDGYKGFLHLNIYLEKCSRNKKRIRAGIIDKGDASEELKNEARRLIYEEGLEKVIVEDY